MSVGGKIASARDAGNIGAGIVAGRNGYSWSFSRLAFDALESYQKSEITTEGNTTQKAQKVGYEIGNDLWHKYNED
ncbi:hypothetical protein [Flavobacterium sp. KACC 22763]|uniref:hypothetical protein n=1 Tax=Flavobacterium sp. KACC 22763 TaxID=3025668 RepID=UPI002365E915|nr:hypothetical protein [Flavobacterium sp. KACC 22763]WDF65930.1 hypothetical protein PQ463_07105 [Flavobacterium sp. KACC 22763]